MTQWLSIIYSFPPMSLDYLQITYLHCQCSMKSCSIEQIRERREQKMFIHLHTDAIIFSNIFDPSSLNWLMWNPQIRKAHLSTGLSYLYKSYDTFLIHSFLHSPLVLFERLLQIYSSVYLLSLLSNGLFNTFIEFLISLILV